MQIKKHLFLWHIRPICLFFFLCISGVRAQENKVTISGTVKDESGNPIPSVSVKVKDQAIGTGTDERGTFSLTLPEPKGILVFTSMGYESLEISIDNRTTFDIVLKADNKALEEVVVVGYGSQKKADITGSVSVVNVDESKKLSTNDISQLLQGRSAGVSVTSDGHPGAAPNVRIRGLSTFGDAQPLYVIDGVPVGTSPRDFNPNDIASMQVLKDASAGAIYGSRAANGVIIITTKQGQLNTPLRIEYDGYYGVDKVWQRIPVLDRARYQMVVNEVRSNAGQSLIPGNDPNSSLFIDDIDTDWQKDGLKTGNRQNHHVNFSGGGNNTTYNMSFDYFGNNGTFVGNGPTYDRYAARVNSTASKGIFKVGQSFYYTHSNENTLTYRPDVLTGGRPPLIVDLVAAVPTQAIYDPNNEGGFGGTEAEIHNVISLNAIGVNSMMKNYVDVDRIFANAYGELELINRNGHNLSYKLNVSWDRTVTRDYSFQPAFRLGYFFQQTVSRLDDGSRILSTGLVENTLTYKKDFGKHHVNLLIGQMYQEGSTVERNGHSESFPKPYFPVLDNGSNKNASGNEFKNALSSYLGRLNYGYDEKYLLTATLRRDGSSRFAPQHRYGYFPSIALAWRLMNEDFLKLPAHIFSDLKLRASYGTLGNQNIGDYLYSSYINNNILYNFNGQPIIGGIQTNLVSSNIRWETKATTNIGLDASFLNGAVDFSAEYYNSKTTDLLVGVPIPASTGSLNTAPVVNAGSLRNKGIELTATYHKSRGAFTFDISGNVTTVKNKVLALGGSNEPIYGTGAKTEVGGEIGQHFGWLYDGVFQSQQEVEQHAFQSSGTAPGDIRFKDLNNDGVINADDRTYLGSAIPSLNYGINFNASYKRVDFTVFAAGSTGFLVNSRMYRDLMLSTDYINRHEDILNRWTPENTDTNIPRLIANDPNINARDSDRPGWLQNGSFLRINTVALGYTFKEGLIKGVHKARIYFTAQNVYTFQSYKGFNPDFTSGVFNPGFDFGSFPKPRTFMVGIQAGF